MDTSTLDPSEKEEMVLDAIDQTRGRFFGITFRKKDGSIRHMNARTHPDDDPPHWNPEEQGMKVVWDVQAGGFKTITASTVERFTFASKTVKFD